MTSLKCFEDSLIKPEGNRLTGQKSRNWWIWISSEPSLHIFTFVPGCILEILYLLMKIMGRVIAEVGRQLWILWRQGKLNEIYWDYQPFWGIPDIQSPRNGDPWQSHVATFELSAVQWRSASSVPLWAALEFSLPKISCRVTRCL
jgi:hypothetical protein